jgi:hypothetical protein
VEYLPTQEPFHPALFFLIPTVVSPRKSRKVASSSQPSDEVLRINNSTSEFMTSNNFTRSSNDYIRHLPQHLKEPQTPVKCPATLEEGGVTKMCTTSPSPPSEPSVFTFASNGHMPHHMPAQHTPKSPQYCGSVAGASASSASSDGSYHESGGGDKQTDPNIQLNYKARVYLTNSQRETYGKNMLTRMPSIDGSKSKYTGIVDRVSSCTTFADSLPHQHHSARQHHAAHQRRKDVVELDSELCSSQC